MLKVGCYNVEFIGRVSPISTERKKSTKRVDLCHINFYTKERWVEELW